MPKSGLILRARTGIPYGIKENAILKPYYELSSWWRRKRRLCYANPRLFLFEKEFIASPPVDRELHGIEYIAFKRMNEDSYEVKGNNLFGGVIRVERGKRKSLFVSSPSHYGPKVVRLGELYLASLPDPINLNSQMKKKLKRDLAKVKSTLKRKEKSNWYIAHPKWIRPLYTSLPISYRLGERLYFEILEWLLEDILEKDFITSTNRLTLEYVEFPYF